MKIDIPCKIGDTVWAVRNYKGVSAPMAGKVSEMFFTADMELCIVVRHIRRGRWGKDIFPTAKEAQNSIDRKTSKANGRSNCLECRHFVSCESGKQFFHKISDTPCDEFDRSERYGFNDSD